MFNEFNVKCVCVISVRFVFDLTRLSLKKIELWKKKIMRKNIFIKKYECTKIFIEKKMVKIFSRTKFLKFLIKKNSKEKMN